jgi:hypothetical protein
MLAAGTTEACCPPFTTVMFLEYIADEGVLTSQNSVPPISINPPQFDATSPKMLHPHPHPRPDPQQRPRARNHLSLPLPGPRLPLKPPTPSVPSAQQPTLLQPPGTPQLQAVVSHRAQTPA